MLTSVCARLAWQMDTPLPATGEALRFTTSGSSPDLVAWQNLDICYRAHLESQPYMTRSWTLFFFLGTLAVALSAASDPV